ncbi:hypothetical protein, partial [Enterococcus sp. 6D12_DIV0197]|uniref:hypothetical protein n=1 Tax=Enterococcus sp. 6D12_DIV0197 TaxID=1834184 RepID=UPI001BAEE38F
IYLIRHSGEDIEACHLIKDLFKYNDSVKIISEDMTPSEFEKLIPVSYTHLDVYKRQILSKIYLNIMIL